MKRRTCCQRESSDVRFTLVERRKLIHVIKTCFTSKVKMKLVLDLGVWIFVIDVAEREIFYE